MQNEATVKDAARRVEEAVRGHEASVQRYVQGREEDLFNTSLQVCTALQHLHDVVLQCTGHEVDYSITLDDDADGDEFGFDDSPEPFEGMAFHATLEGVCASTSSVLPDEVAHILGSSISDLRDRGFLVARIAAGWGELDG